MTVEESAKPMQTESLRGGQRTAVGKRLPARAPDLDQMSTVEFLAHLHRADVELWAEGDRLRGRVHLRALRASLGEIVRRHEILRTTFADGRGQPEQVIAPRLAVELPVIDLGHLPAAGREAAGMRLARAFAQQPFGTG